MPKIKVRNHDDPDEKLSVDELNARLKKNLPHEDEADSDELIKKELNESLDEPGDSEEWIDEFSDDQEEKEKEPKSEPEPETEAEPEDPKINDEETEAAVEDIEKADSDEILKNEDEKRAEASEDKKPKTLKQKIGHFFKAWWSNKLYRNLTLVGLGLIILAFIVIPTLRYFALNTVGIRAKASIFIIDNKTLLPLKNVKVSIAGEEQLTNNDGYAELSNLKLGPTELNVTKVAFASEQRPMTVGLGSNPLGEQKMHAVGAQYVFAVTDWLSGKPIEKAEASSGESSALSDKNGNITLTVEEPKSDAVDVEIKYDNYRTEKLKIKADDKTVHKVSIVPARKHLFVSKRTGKYDVYKIDTDGKNEQVLLSGTGLERDDMVLVSAPDGKTAALVTTRDGVRNSDGYLLSTLYIIDVGKGSIKKIMSSERIQPVDWIDKRLVYVAIAEGASASNPKRHRLMTYNNEENTNKEIAATNYFNDVIVIAGRIYYAPSNAYNLDPANARLFVVEGDGGSKKTILGQEAWNVFRTGYNTISIATSSQWYSYKLGDETAQKQTGPPASQRSKLFIDNSNRSKSIWVDERDGKGVLLLQDVKTSSDKTLISKAGITTPMYWLSDGYIIYRVSTDTETADYLISAEGGEPKKIKDVSNIGGIDTWYYY